MVEIRIEDDKPRETDKETIIIQHPKEKHPAKEKIIIKHPKEKKKPRARNQNAGRQATNEMMKLLKANQDLADKMIKINTAIMENVASLASSVASLTEKMNNFLAKEKREEMPTIMPDEFEERIKKIENKINSLIISLSPAE